MRVCVGGGVYVFDLHVGVAMGTFKHLHVCTSCLCVYTHHHL